MINPNVCWSSEAGVYILLFFNLLYFVGCVIFGVIFSAWTITVALEDETYPLGYRAVNTGVWISFVLFFAIETYLGSNLLTAVNKSDNPNEFRRWVKIRIVLLLFIGPIIGIFAYIHFSLLTISILGVIAVYQLYYIWICSYYAYELDIILETDSMGIGGGAGEDKT